MSVVKAAVLTPEIVAPLYFSEGESHCKPLSNIALHVIVRFFSSQSNTRQYLDLTEAGRRSGLVGRYVVIEAMAY
jgi:hypothetical protein